MRKKEKKSSHFSLFAYFVDISPQKYPFIMSNLSINHLERNSDDEIENGKGWGKEGGVEGTIGEEEKEVGCGKSEDQVE